MIPVSDELSTGSPRSSRVFAANALGPGTDPETLRTYLWRVLRGPRRARRAGSGSLAGELGDLLFQILFPARLSGSGAGSTSRASPRIRRKMTERHPHVFGGHGGGGRGGSQTGLGAAQAAGVRRRGFLWHDSPLAAGARFRLSHDVAGRGPRFRLGARRRRGGEDRRGARRVARGVRSGKPIRRGARDRRPSLLVVNLARRRASTRSRSAKNQGRFRKRFARVADRARERGDVETSARRSSIRTGRTRRRRRGVLGRRSALLHQLRRPLPGTPLSASVGSSLSASPSSRDTGARSRPRAVLSRPREELAERPVDRGRRRDGVEKDPARHGRKGDLVRAPATEASVVRLSRRNRPRSARTRTTARITRGRLSRPNPCGC